MNWRQWIYETLIGPTITPYVAASSVFAGGSLEVNPQVRPFIVIRIQSELPTIRDGGRAIRTQRFAEVWVHDDPGSYDRIDLILDLVRAVLVDPVWPGATCCDWIGNSPELSDPDKNTIVRNAQFNLIGSAS